MSPHHAAIHEIRLAVTSGVAPQSVESIARQLEPLTTGLRQSLPVLTAGARLFRVRQMCNRPNSTHEVGLPPRGIAPVNRLNDEGESVLYVADSPGTAFAEARAESGVYCLSEWRVQRPKVLLANGGIPLSLLRARFPNNFDATGSIVDGSEDQDVLALLTNLFTLEVNADRTVYRWSIACGLASGFAAICDRTSKDEVDGNTNLCGRYPLSGIAYASMRMKQQAINFAFNDLGSTFLKLDHVQWVEWRADGNFSGIDYGSVRHKNGAIEWQGRAARYLLGHGSAARVVKVDATTWQYEQFDGEIPVFS